MKKMWFCLAAIVLALYLGACHSSKQNSSDKYYDKYYGEKSRPSQTTSQEINSTSGQAAGSDTHNSGTLSTTAGQNISGPGDNNNGATSESGMPSVSSDQTTKSSSHQGASSSSAPAQTMPTTKGSIDQTPVDEEGNEGWSGFITV